MLNLVVQIPTTDVCNANPYDTHQRKQSDDTQPSNQWRFLMDGRPIHYTIWSRTVI